MSFKRRHVPVILSPLLDPQKIADANVADADILFRGGRGRVVVHSGHGEHAEARLVFDALVYPSITKYKRQQE